MVRCSSAPWKCAQSPHLKRPQKFPNGHLEVIIINCDPMLSMLRQQLLMAEPVHGLNGKTGVSKP